MKKLLLVVLFLFPTLAFAQTSFDTNLSYGATGSGVTALQEFLVTQHVLAPQYVTGNFYSLTLAAVKTFQTDESISPVSGYVGPITRSTINTILASEVPVSEGDAATSTEPVDLSQSTTTPVYTPFYSSQPSYTGTNVQSNQMTDTQPACVPNPQLTLSVNPTTFPAKSSIRSDGVITPSATYTTGCPIDITTPYSYSVVTQDGSMQLDGGGGTFSSKNIDKQNMWIISTDGMTGSLNMVPMQSYLNQGDWSLPNTLVYSLTVGTTTQTATILATNATSTN